MVESVVEPGRLSKLLGKAKPPLDGLIVLSCDLRLQCGKQGPGCPQKRSRVDLVVECTSVSQHECSHLYKGF